MLAVVLLPGQNLAFSLESKAEPWPVVKVFEVGPEVGQFIIPELGFLVLNLRQSANHISGHL